MTDRHEKMDRLICQGRVKPPPPAPVAKDGFIRGACLAAIILGYIGLFGAAVVVLSLKWHVEQPQRILKCR